MKHCIILLISILFISCQFKTTEWQAMDFGPFTLSTPNHWRMIKEKGIDSYTGGLTNQIDTIQFDYGQYSTEFDIGPSENEDSISYLYAIDTIQGNIANFIKPTKSGKGLIGVSIAKVKNDKKNGLAIYAFNVSNQEVILKILKTLSFKRERKTINGKTPDLTFMPGPIKSGKLIYAVNCAGCHSITKELVGPALDRHLTVRSKDWIYTFLTERKLISKDSLMDKNISNFQMECRVFPTLINSDFNLLYDYLRNR